MLTNFSTPEVCQSLPIRLLLSTDQPEGLTTRAKQGNPSGSPAELAISRPASCAMTSFRTERPDGIAQYLDDWFVSLVKSPTWVVRRSI